MNEKDSLGHSLKELREKYNYYIRPVSKTVDCIEPDRGILISITKIDEEDTKYRIHYDAEGIIIQDLFYIGPVLSCEKLIRIIDNFKKIISDLRDGI